MQIQHKSKTDPVNSFMNDIRAAQYIKVINAY